MSETGPLPGRIECPGCAKSVPSDRSHCPNCGKRLPRPSSPHAEPSPPAQADDPRKPRTIPMADEDDPFAAIQLVPGPPDIRAVPVPEYPGILIGRSVESPFAGHQLLQDNVSRIHARVWRQEDGVVLVQDEGSTNGTWIGAQRLTPGKPVAFHPTQELRLATEHPVRLRLDHD